MLLNRVYDRMVESLRVSDKQWGHTVVVATLMIGLTTPIQAADTITLQNEESRIQWGAGFPRDSEYKDIQLAPFDDAGNLMLYLPVTRPVDGKHIAALMRWDPSANGGAGAFVDITASAFPFQDEDSPRDTYDADFADIDQDGDYDIVHSSPHGAFIYINDGSGVFSDETSTRFPPIVRTDKVDVWDDIVVADVDGDGDLDIFLSNRTFGISDGRPSLPDPANWGPNILLYNDGEGFFNRAPGPIETNYDLFGQPSVAPYVGEIEAASHGTKFGDLNNDGRLDMVLSHKSSYTSNASVTPQAVDIYLNEGSTAEGRVRWSAPTGFGGTNHVSNVGLFDADNDGNLDIYLARTGADTILIGNGDGTFQAPVSVESLAGGTPPEFGTRSYDVVFGDLNDDGRIDVVAPEADGTYKANNKIFLNDTSVIGGLAFERSNDLVVNSATDPHQVSAAIADVNRDGKLDIVWGMDARSSRNPGTEPMVTMNTTAGLSDNTEPVINEPSLFLSSNGTPAAAFAVRIRDRVQDIDEITANMQWSVTGSEGANNIGSAPLQWAAVDSYLTRLSCGVLRQGFAVDESITGFVWDITANDLAGNSASLASGDAVAPNLLPSLSDGTGTALGLSIREPLEGASRLVPNDGTGRLLVRVSVLPRNLEPMIDQFEVLINGTSAEIITGQRVANEFWLAVEAPAGPVGAHDLQVRYRLCDFEVVSPVENNAVFYDDDVRLADTVLVVDASGSMKDDRKMESAINAAKLYANVMRDPENLGVVEYSGSSGTLASNVFGPAVAGDAPAGGSPLEDNRAAAAQATTGIIPGGCTPLGQGLLQGLAQLDGIAVAERNERRTLVLLSDGKQNVPPFWASPPSSICGGGPTGAPVFDTFEALRLDGNPNNNVKINTVSLGPDSDSALMTAIASATDGEDIVVDILPSPENVSFWFEEAEQHFAGLISTAHAQVPTVTRALENLLANAYEHQHNAASYQQRLWQTVHIATGQGTPPVPVENAPFSVGEGADDALVSSRFSSVAATDTFPRSDMITVPVESGLDYAVIAVNWPTSRGQVFAQPPAGQDLSAIKVVRRDTNTVFQIDEPVAGDWQLGLTHEKGTEIMVTLSGISSEIGFVRAVTGEELVYFEEDSYVVPRRPEPGESVPIHLVLVGNDPVLGANVIANAQGRNGQKEIIRMVDDGSGADQVAGDGVYSGVLTATRKGGAFAVSVAAEWTGADAVHRQRIFPLTVVLKELDSDGDTISDLDEESHGLDPNNPFDAFEDQDGDGVITWREIELGLDPFNADTDGGGVNDGNELAGSTDPKDPRDDDEVGKDSDGDGMTDHCEKRWGFDPNDPSDAADDLDNDGLTNREECQVGTSPIDRDTDGDGTIDGDEVANGTDPLDPLNREAPKESSEPSEPKEKISKLALICLILFAIALILLAIVILQRYRINKLGGGA